MQTAAQEPVVPRLDLGDARSADKATRVRFQRGLRDALTRFGFVRIRGHEIDQGLIRRVFGEFEEFFSGSDPEKLRCASAAGGQRGFTSFGVEHAKDHPEPDLKEFYHVGRELPQRHRLRPQYPDNIWPANAPALRSQSLALYAALDGCAATLLESLALGFELPIETFSAMLHEGNSILRALHYPPLSPPLSGSGTNKAIRAAPHEDINLITLLCEATDAGLEILTRDGAWLRVPALEGEIVVDAGDMLSRITNDVVPAATHRVVTPDAVRDRHRYSLPYFAHPYPDCDLSVHEAFVSAETPAKYPPITAAVFLEERLKQIGLIS